MRMNRSISAVAVLGTVALLAACADQATAPAARVALPRPGFAVGDARTYGADPVPGELTVCKHADSNVSGTFDFSSTTVNGGSGSVVGNGLVVAPGECKLAATSSSPSGSGINVIVDEQGSNVPAISGFESDGVSITPLLGLSDPTASPGFFINSIHGIVVTYLNNVAEGCTLTQGFWKTHGPTPTGNNSNEWPVTSLTLGTVNYTDVQLLSILNTAPKGNGLLTLAHQLIAAKLNIANGADGSSISATIAAADALIGGLVIPPVGSGSLSSSAVASLVTALTNFNQGATGPGHCGDEIVAR